MPVTMGNQPGQYAPTVRHVSNGEKANETTLRRPSIDLENRTDALKQHSEAVETLLSQTVQRTTTLEAHATQTDLTLTQQNTAAQNHINDASKHTKFATEAEAKDGTSATLTMSPALVKAVMAEAMSLMYSAVVGPEGVFGVTHTTLAEALLAAQDGHSILVTNNQVVDVALEINANNVELHFRRGASLIAGTATTGLIVNADHLLLSSARFQGFEVGVLIENTADGTCIRNTRFNTCLTTITDNGTNSSEIGTLQE